MNETSVELYGTCIALQYKLGRSLSVLEAELIKVLTDVYGNELVFYAITGWIEEDPLSLANLFMQVGGFPDKVPHCLNGILMNEEIARERLPERDFQISLKKKAFISRMKSGHIKGSSKDEYPVAAFREWETVSGEKLNGKTKQSLDKALNCYGSWFVTRAIKVISGKKVKDAETRIELFNSWLKAAKEKDYGKLDKIVKRAGHQGFRLNWRVNRPCFPLFHEDYFTTVYGRQPRSTEVVEMEKIIQGENPLEFIFAIGSLPAGSFSISELEFHYQKKRDPYAYVRRKLKHEKWIFYCRKCLCYLEESQRYYDSKDIGRIGNCPICGSEIEEHELEPVLNHIREKYGEMIYDYEFSDINGLAYVDFCSHCGHTYSGTEYTTTLRITSWEP